MKSNRMRNSDERMLSEVETIFSIFVMLFGAVAFMFMAYAAFSTNLKPSLSLLLFILGIEFLPYLTLISGFELFTSRSLKHKQIFTASSVILLILTIVLVAWLFTFGNF